MIPRKWFRNSRRPHSLTPALPSVRLSIVLFRRDFTVLVPRSLLKSLELHLQIPSREILDPSPLLSLSKDTKCQNLGVMKFLFSGNGCVGKSRRA